MKRNNDKEDFINKYISKISGGDSNFLEYIKNELIVLLNDYEVTKIERSVVPYQGNLNEEAIKMFMIAKKVEGLSNSSLKYYSLVLRNFTKKMGKNFNDISTNDIRYYLAVRELEDEVSKTTLNNERRVLRVFYSFCVDEGYIQRNPVEKIKNIKEPKRIKKPFSEIEIEKLRNVAKDEREKLVIELLLSTGMRAAEVCSINIEHIDFSKNEIYIVGKGNKERVVFLNAKAQLAIKRYIEKYGIGTGPLLKGKSKGGRLGRSGLEGIVKRIGKRAQVSNCHPHRFRRTTASLALNRGMPIDQVSKLLGHENVETTTIYAITDNDNLKAGHKKYVT